MTLDFSTDGKVRIDMREYINKILEELQDLVDGWEGTTVTLAAEYLFRVNKKTKKLNTKESEHFHQIVVQLLFLCKRGQPDIQTGVVFLTTHVKQERRFLR